jgi:para-nitrobenzyl esterase
MVNFPFLFASGRMHHFEERRRMKMDCRKRPILWSSIALLVLGVFIFIAPAQAWDSHNPIAKTDYGKLKGYVNEDALVWKGVPYARPPVGELRWKAPEDPEPWLGVRDATVPAQKCTQLLTTKEWLRTGAVDPESSEDCLYLDIYRPERPTYQWERLPVYVWIHGGSNNFGTARDYDGTRIAEQSNVVVVVVQYRLGPLGWFYHPAIQTGGADILSDSGNFGTLDHAQALKWIHENIDAFGGNPHNVTVTGESAGAHNTMNMVISPLGKGLFHRAMSESGGMRTVPPLTTTDLKIVPGRTQANDIIEKLLMYNDNVPLPVSPATRALYAQKRVDMENAGTLEAYLRATTAGDFFLAIAKYGSVPTFPAIEDGTVMPVGGWIPAIQAGNYNKMPIILGANQYESKSFMPLYGPLLKPPYPNGYGVPSGTYSWFNLIDVLKGKTKPDGNPLTVDDVLPTQHDKDIYELTGFYGSQNWKAKFVDTVANELAKVQHDVYAYLFKWGGIGSGPSPFDFIYGAGHAAEIYFFFGADQGLFGYPFVPANEAGRKDLQDAMMEYLKHFAWTGNPNHYFPCPQWLENWSHFTCLPRWKEWSNVSGAPKAIVFDADFDRAHITMMNEELTVEGVTAAFEAAMTAKNLTLLEKAAARVFQFSSPW